MFFILVTGCKTRIGEISPLAPPSTSIFLNGIDLSDSNSLSGRINLSWIGESANGYVKGYEIASDTAACNLSTNLTWSYTNLTDSSFLFKVPSGHQFAKISFYVRAIDNLNAKDPSPSCLEVPVKNSTPTIKLDKPYPGSRSVTDTVHSVFTISWQTNDADGIENLDSIYVKFNNSSWISFGASVNQVTFVPISPDSPDSTFCKILVGNTAKIYSKNIGSLQMNTLNTVLVKSKDISNSFSITDTVKAFYYKRKTGDLLYVDSYKANTSDRAIIDPILKEKATSGYDVYDMNRAGDIYLPLNWNLAFTEYLKLYKKVLWVSDDYSYGGNSAIELGISAIQNYLNQGGKIWISITKLPTDANSPIYQFSPFDSVSTKPGQARLASGSKVPPLQNFSANYDTLINTAFTIAATPGYIKSTANALYTTKFQALNGWSGPNIVAAMSNGPAGKPNQVYFTLDIQNLNGNPTGLKKLFDRILNQEFAY